MKNKLFRERVLEIVSRIPRGKTLSYAAVAKLAGNPQAARAVGAVMRANHDPAIPCHRVIRSDGTPGGFNRGTASKTAILRQEGRKD